MLFVDWSVCRYAISLIGDMRYAQEMKQLAEHHYLCEHLTTRWLLIRILLFQSHSSFCPPSHALYLDR